MQPAFAPECMTARARVRQTFADSTVDLAVLPGPRCSGCEGTCLWGWSPPSSLRVHDSGFHRPGDEVEVSLRTAQVLHGSLLLHGLPWAGLLAGAAVGVAAVGGDAGALLGALAGISAGVVTGRRLQDRFSVCPQLTRVGDP